MAELLPAGAGPALRAVAMALGAGALCPPRACRSHEYSPCSGDGATQGCDVPGAIPTLSVADVLIFPHVAGT